MSQNNSTKDNASVKTKTQRKKKYAEAAMKQQQQAEKRRENLALSQTLTCKSLFWLGIILFVAMPIVNNLILQTILTSLAGNIAYEGLYSVMSIICSAISVLTSYSGLGVLATAIAHFGAKKAIGTVILSILYHPISALASIKAYDMSGASNLNKAFANITFLINGAANLLCYAIILLILILIRRKKTARNQLPELGNKLFSRGGAYSYVIAATLIFSLAQLATRLYDMIDAFLDPSLGLPVNATEWIYWISQYVTLFIYAAIGYLISLSIFYLCKKLQKRFAEEDAVSEA